MRSYVHIPSTSLAGFIDLFYLNTAESSTIQVVNFPGMHQELMFNLGDHFGVKDNNGTYDTSSDTSWLSGLHTVPVTTVASGRHLSAGILFKPWGLRQLFGINPSDLTNNALNTTGLIGNVLETFAQEHAPAEHPQQFLQQLEQYILSHYTPRMIRQEVINAVNAVERADKGSIRKLAASVGCTSKHFISTFNSITGLTPLRYLHLKQVTVARNMIKQYPGMSLTGISYESGFYDQAHFTRIFRSFCGITPQQYRKQATGSFYTIPGSSAFTSL
jgi:AraC-like DNA-binding protein